MGALYPSGYVGTLCIRLDRLKTFSNLSYTNINGDFIYILATFLQFLKGDNLLITKWWFCQRCIYRGIDIGYINSCFSESGKKKWKFLLTN